MLTALFAAIAKRPIPFVVAFIALLAFLFAMVVYIDKSADRKVGNVKETISEILSKFKSGEITTTFTSEWIDISKSNKLEVAKMVSEETLKKFHTNIFGDTEAEIMVPATYRFHIKLDDDWYIEKRNNICLVIAPKIWPTLPVGFDTKNVKKKATSSLNRWDKLEILEELEKSISSRLAYQSTQNIKFVKDTARLSVADFIKKWLFNQGEWKEGLFNTIIVKFSDEISKEELKEIKKNELKPTIELSDFSKESLPSVNPLKNAKE